MKQQKTALITVFAIIGVCAVLYFFWQTYQQHLQEQRARAFVSGPPQAYKPRFRTAAAAMIMIKEASHESPKSR